MHAFLVSAAAFIVLVGIMVLVHEMGHFVVAKLFGVRVEAFSIGFGPRLFGVKYGDTDYKICLLPVGGFVKMTGENMGEIQGPDEVAAPAIEDPGSFTAHPRWQRMLIGVAGPVSNFILAFALMVFYFGWINEVPPLESKNSTIEWIVPGSAAAKAGLETGDQIVRFDTVDNPDWDMIYAHSKLSAGQPVSMAVERDGSTLPVTLDIPASAKQDEFDFSDEGLLPQILLSPIKVDQVGPGTPAEKAGLRAGDSILAVDGHPFHYIGTLLAYMQAGQGKPITLTVLRNGATVSLVASPRKLDVGYKLGFAVGPMPFRAKPLPFAAAVVKARGFCADNSTLILEMLKRLFTHKVSISELQGPVGIARMAGDAAEIKGWQPKFVLASEISINLGIINLLPFPILDGGMIMFLLIESLLRHDINIAVKERIYQAAFVVLMVFFVFIIVSDVTKLPLFTHMKP